MDPLSRLLTLNTAEGSIDKNCMLTGDWHLSHNAGDLSVIRWHTTTKGTARLDMPSGDSFMLSPGCVVILPHNSAHKISHQTMDEGTFIICGSLSIERSSRYFLTALPEVLLLQTTPDSPQYHWLCSSIAMLQQESSNEGIGTHALCGQQCSSMLTLALRDWLSRSTQDKSLLNLLIHPRLGKILLNMLESPSNPWTVDKLAQQVHMSRASFAQLFRQVSGSTPLTVLTTLRMQIAAQRLSREPSSVTVIAESVGYSSESSFHKAFVREFGYTPGDYRKRVKSIS